MLGVYGWLKPQKTNKTFLNNTLKSVLLANSIADRKTERSSSSRKCSSDIVRNSSDIQSQMKHESSNSSSHYSSSTASQNSTKFSGKNSRPNCSYRYTQNEHPIHNIDSSSDSSDCMVVLDPRILKRKRTASTESSSKQPDSPISKCVSSKSGISEKAFCSSKKINQDKFSETSTSRRSKSSHHKRSKHKHKSRKHKSRSYSS